MEHIDFLRVGAAGLAGFIFGAIWYTVLGKAWMAAADVTEEQAKPKPVVLGMTFVCQLVIAFVLSHYIRNPDYAIGITILSVIPIWVGFILMTQIVNHRFQGRPWSLTIIDSGHWLGVLIVQAVVLSLLD